MKKAEELRELTDTQLDDKIGDLKESLFRLRFKLALGNNDVVKQLRQDRRNLARIHTIKTQRAIAAGQRAGKQR
ncbi:MAG TPA: 50S ribosomal protein L29 [Blastocatellia bacterium]|nr:50S ribosomal protein L29 [Blastocatellia bacterium]